MNVLMEFLQPVTLKSYFKGKINTLYNPQISAIPQTTTSNKHPSQIAPPFFPHFPFLLPLHLYFLSFNYGGISTG